MTAATSKNSGEHTAIPIRESRMSIPRFMRIRPGPIAGDMLAFSFLLFTILYCIPLLLRHPAPFPHERLGGAKDNNPPRAFFKILKESGFGLFSCYFITGFSQYIAKIRIFFESAMRQSTRPHVKNTERAGNSPSPPPVRHALKGTCPDILNFDIFNTATESLTSRFFGKRTETDLFLQHSIFFEKDRTFFQQDPMFFSR